MVVPRQFLFLMRSQCRQSGLQRDRDELLILAEVIESEFIGSPSRS
jgi:hypothetical protein